MAGDNKPILPNSFVNINNQNLGFIPGRAVGVMAFVGFAQEGAATFDAIKSIGNNNEVKTEIGFGELADHLIQYFNNGGRKALAVPIDIVTESVLSAVTKTPVAGGTGTGTITVAKASGKKVTNIFTVQVEITKTGTLGAGKFKVSTDGGVNFGPETLIPSGGTFVVPGTNIELTFVPGAGPVFFEDGDLHDFTSTKPAISTAKVEAAVDTLIADTADFDAIVISSDADAALMSSIKTKVQAAEGKPDFRYHYAIMKPDLSTSVSNALTDIQTIRATVGDDRLQIVSGEAFLSRSNHGDEREMNVIGVIAGRRSALNIQNDLGRFAAGALSDVLKLRTGWTETVIEDLDAEETVTIRVFKGVAGFFPTNGHLSDPTSDFKKDAFRLVIDKASRIARLTGLSFLKTEVDPAAVAASTKPLKSAIENAINNQMTGNNEIVRVAVDIPDGQDVLTSEIIVVNISVLPFSHASFIQNEIGLINPLTAA